MLWTLGIRIKLKVKYIIHAVQKKILYNYVAHRQYHKWYSIMI